MFRNYYYFAIVEDLILRFSWTYILAFKELEKQGRSPFRMEIIITVFACLEVIRRWVWIRGSTQEI